MLTEFPESIANGLRGLVEIGRRNIIGCKFELNLEGEHMREQGEQGGGVPIRDSDCRIVY